MKFLSILSAVLAALALVNGYPQKIDQKNLPEDQQAAPTDKEKSKSDEDDSDMYMEAMEQQTEGTVLNESPNQPNQAFYPSFSPFHNPPLGHSRPFYYQPEAAYSHRPSPPYQQQISYDNNARFTGYKDNYDERSDETGGILGSGNFGVIKGGTFYNDNDDAYAYGDDYSSYYQNGHGRPSFYFGNPQPRQYQQFENFRDFADINTPTSPAYSHFVVVYANKNATDKTTHARSEPKNIIERLAMLDMEGTTSDAPPTKKASHSKRKLALLLPEKKTSRTSPVKRARDVYEPLLALS